MIPVLMGPPKLTQAHPWRFDWALRFFWILYPRFLTFAVKQPIQSLYQAIGTYAPRLGMAQRAGRFSARPFGLRKPTRYGDKSLVGPPYYNPHSRGPPCFGKVWGRFIVRSSFAVSRALPKSASALRHVPRGLTTAAHNIRKYGLSMGKFKI